jgi:hypothetical protein
MDGLQRGAWIPVQGRGLVFITDDMAAAQAAATALASPLRSRRSGSGSSPSSTAP